MYYSYHLISLVKSTSLSPYNSDDDDEERDLHDSQYQSDDDITPIHEYDGVSLRFHVVKTNKFGVEQKRWLELDVVEKVSG